MSTPYSFFRHFLPSLTTGCALLSLVLLGGCEDDASLSTFAPACPKMDVPGSISERFVYDGKGIDVRNQISHTQILSVNGDCRNGPKDSQGRPLTRIRLSLGLQQELGLAATDTSYPAPYFVAIMQDGKILDKKNFSDTIHLPSGVNTKRINTPLRFIDLPTGSNPQISPYTLEVGFQLSRDELEYNRQHLTSFSRFKNNLH